MQETVNLHESLHYLKKFLRAIALWYEDDNLLAIIYSKFVAICLIILVILLNIYMCLADFDTIVNIMSLTLTLDNCSLKFFLFDLKKVKKLLNYFDEDLFQPQNHKQFKILQRAVFFTKHVTCIYGILVVITWLFIGFISWQQKILPAAIWVPQYVQEHYFWHCFVYCMYVAGELGMIGQAFASLLVLFMVHIGAQCDLLKNEVENLAGGRLDEMQHLRRCIRHHQLILKFTNEFLAIFHNVILAQFIDSVTVYCFMMYKFANMSLGWEFIGQIFYLLCIFFEPLLLCWFGNEITFKSGIIAHKVFTTQWYKASLAFQKDFIFFMHRLQKPIVISVGKLFTANIIVWVTITKSAWSYCLMLMQMNSMKK